VLLAVGYKRYHHLLAFLTKGQIMQINVARTFSKAIPAVLAAITGGLLTLFGMWYFAKSPHLSCSAVEALPFSAETGSTLIYHVFVENDGNMAVENVVCHVSVPGAKFEKNRVGGAPSLKRQI
jgi:hypothetical protein